MALTAVPARPHTLPPWRPRWPFEINLNSWEAKGLQMWTPLFFDVPLKDMVTGIQLTSDNTGGANTRMAVLTYLPVSSQLFGPLRHFVAVTSSSSSSLRWQNPRRPSFNFGGTGGPMTLSAWVRVRITSAADQAFMGTSATTTTFGISGTTQSVFIKRSYATTQKVRISNETLINNVLYHVVATDDNTTAAANMHLYVNGQELTYATTTDGVAPVAASGALSIPGAGGSSLYDGAIADCRVYNYQMTPIQVKQLYIGATNFDLYRKPKPMIFVPPVPAPTFNPAWAIGSNNLISGGFGR